MTKSGFSLMHCKNRETTFAGNMNEDWNNEEEEATENDMRGVALTCISLATFLIAAVVMVIFLLANYI